MKVGQLKKLLSKFKDDTEVFVLTWQTRKRKRGGGGELPSPLKSGKPVIEMDTNKVNLCLEPRHIITSDRLAEKAKGGKRLAFNLDEKGGSQ